MGKIKSVRKNGVEFVWSNSGQLWESKKMNKFGYNEYIPEEVILNCPLFEIKYEPERWRADYSKEYYYITSTGYVQSGTEIYCVIDNRCYEFGNYFQTKEEAETVLAKFQQVLNDFHKSKLESK